MPGGGECGLIKRKRPPKGALPGREGGPAAYENGWLAKGCLVAVALETAGFGLTLTLLVPVAGGAVGLHCASSRFFVAWAGVSPNPPKLCWMYSSSMASPSAFRRTRSAHVSTAAIDPAGAPQPAHRNRSPSGASWKSWVSKLVSPSASDFLSISITLSETGEDDNLLTNDFTGLRRRRRSHSDLANPAFRAAKAPSVYPVLLTRDKAAPQVAVRPRGLSNRTPVRAIQQFPGLW